MRTIILYWLCFGVSWAFAGELSHSDSSPGALTSDQRPVSDEKRPDLASCLSKLQHIRGMISQDGGFTPLTDSQEEEVLRNPEELGTYKKEQEAYLNCLMTEMKSWPAEKILPYYQALNRSISENENASFAKYLTHRIDFLAKGRARIEDELFTPVLAELRRDYRNALIPLREKAKKSPLSRDESKKYSDLAFQEYLLLQVSPEELDALRKKRTQYPALDKRAEAFLKAHSTLFEKLAIAEIKRNNLPISEAEFKKYFEPRVSFDAEGNAKLTVVPSMELQKKQAQQAIALSSFERGNRDEKTSVGRLEPLVLPESAEASLGFLKATRKLGLFDRSDRQLVVRSGLRSGGIEANGDETTLITLLASGGASALGQSARGVTNLSKEQILKMAKAGALFGGGLDVTDQAARNFDEWRKGERLSGYSPLQTLYGAGRGALLAPFIGGSKGVADLSKEQIVKMAKAGALFGGGLDVADQAARNFDEWQKGKPMSGYNPLRTLHSAGSGALLAPVVAGNKRLQNVLLLGGAGSTANHLVEGNYGQAFVSGAGTILTPKVIERALKGVSDLSAKGSASSDPHFPVVADPKTGRVVIDKDHASWKAFAAMVERIGKNPNDYEQILINGDFIDAGSLKRLAASGVDVDMVGDRARLIAEVVQYARDQSGGKVVMPGLGNHDATLKGEKVSPRTGETITTYRGEEVAARLKEHGVDVYVVDDIDVADISLPVPEGASPKSLRASHKTLNYGRNLKELTDPHILARTKRDVRFTGNPQASGDQVGTLSSDTHSPVLIEGLHNPSATFWGNLKNLFKYGQFYRHHAYFNTGSLNPLVNATMLEGGIPRTMGTFGEYQTDRLGRLHWKIIGVAEGPSGRYETFEIDPKNYSALVPAPYGDGIARPIYRNTLPQGLDPEHLSLLYQASRMAPLFLSVPYPVSNEEKTGE